MTPLVVDLYGRLSHCPEDGSLEKVDAQLADCRAVAARSGWTVGAEHRDDSLSAWRRGVYRPGWEAMLARIETGAIDGVLVWHTDRLLRQPRDLERLIDLGDKRGLLLASAYGQHDISNADDRLIMRINAAVACKASDDASRRIKRRFKAMRKAGRVAGRGRAFGFPGGDRTAEKDDSGKRPPVPAAQVEREREALRRAAADVLAGRSLAGIAATWNDAGLLSSRGTRWIPITVRQVLGRASNAGLIEHDDTIVGRMPGAPIFDQEIYDRLTAVFAAKRRGRVAGETSLATGVILCGACDRPLSVRPHGTTYPDGQRRRQYYCVKHRGGCGTVAADVRRVDEALRRITLSLLGDPRHVAGLVAATTEADRRVEELAAEIGRAEAVQQGLADRLGRGEIDFGVFDAGVRPLALRLAKLRAERDALAAEPAGELPDVDAGIAALADQWDNAPQVAERRALLLTALRGHRVGLLPAEGRRVWNEQRIQIIPTRS